jgi:CrcB protein
MSVALFVGIGGFLGAISRYFISLWITKSVSLSFPLGTLVVNVAGSFLIGLAVIFFQNHLSSEYRALVITGFLGALTTFSTFSYESVMLLERGEVLKMGTNIFLNVVLTLVATISAMSLYKKLFI